MEKQMKQNKQENNNNIESQQTSEKKDPEQIKTKYEVYDENNNVITMKAEIVLLHLIQQNDYDNIKECDVLIRNLNYLENFPDIDIDKEVSPLIAASYLGRVDIVRLLLQNPKIDVDYSSKTIRHTPLTVACLSGNYEVLKLLLDAGAEVNKPTESSYTPFLFCFQRLEVEQNVFENRKICLKMVDLLLQYGCDINWIVNKKKGFTLLMQLCAIRSEMSQSEKDINYEIIKFMIENGANKHIISNKGQTAYVLAENHCNKEQIQNLLMNTGQIYFYNKQFTQSQIQNGPDGQQISKNLKPITAPNSKNNHKRSKSLASYLVLCNK